MRIGPAYLILAIIAICIAAGVGGYIAASGPSQPASLQRQEEVAVGKFTAVSPPLPAFALAYTARDGKAARLGDFHGHWLLVNLWATWCGPCIKEMPSLDRMQARLAPGVAVVAISEDRNGAKAVDPFLATLHIDTMKIGLDPAGDIAGALHVQGLPTTFLLDPQGRIVAKLEGTVNWDAAPTLATLKELMTRTGG
jgi:thiol-disulfide isomerase/thioredoxin